MNKTKFWTTILRLFLYINSYCIILFLCSKIFKSFVLDPNHPIIYCVLAGLLLFIINKLISPILNYLTLPITAFTFGLCYFINNFIFLKLVDWILLKHLEFLDIRILVLISILFTFFNLVIDVFIIKPILKGVRHV